MQSGNILSAVLLSALGLASAAQGAVIVEYNTAGFPGTGTAPASIPGINVATGITAADTTRGPGINPAVLANGYSADNWGVGVTTLADAMSGNKYYTWNLTVQPGYKASLSTLDLNMRRSALGAADHFELYASTDAFATAGTLVADWTYFGRSSSSAPPTVTDGQWMTTDTPGQANGNKITTQNLSDDAILQDIMEGTTVTFRLYGYGGQASAANTNTIALGRTTATSPASSGGPLIGGTVTLVPEPATMSLLGLGALTLVRRRK